MTNSDNALRAGLTPKCIGAPVLLDKVKFAVEPAANLLTSSIQQGNALSFPIRVDDFAFSRHYLNGEPQTVGQNSAAIVFGIDGEALRQKIYA